jgi:hypothetical protein
MRQGTSKRPKKGLLRRRWVSDMFEEWAIEAAER